MAELSGIVTARGCLLMQALEGAEAQFGHLFYESKVSSSADQTRRGFFSHELVPGSPSSTWD